MSRTTGSIPTLVGHTGYTMADGVAFTINNMEGMHVLMSETTTEEAAEEAEAEEDAEEEEPEEDEAEEANGEEAPAEEAAP